MSTKCKRRGRRRISASGSKRFCGGATENLEEKLTGKKGQKQYYSINFLRYQRNRFGNNEVTVLLKANEASRKRRVGMARDLAASGTELPALIQAGRWKSERMPALYTRNEAADRGAVARYYGQA